MSVLRLGRRGMGTFFEVTVCGQSESRLRSAAEDALDVIERLDEQLSLFLPTSELSRLNAGAARVALPVEPGLYALLQAARRIHRDTDGAFDVTVGPLLAAWGFRPGRGARDEPASVGMEHVALQEGTARFLCGGVSLDLGGIAKGWALDRAAERLRAHGVRSALLHGGTSTVLALGAPPGQSGWHVGLVDPRDPEHRFGALTLRDRALSTSSSLGRVARDGRRVVGHVIDPRSGQPVRRTAAWAVAPDATTTDALATAFLVLGAAATRRCVKAHPEVGALVLDRRLSRVGLDVAWGREPRTAAGMDRRAFLAGTAAAAAAFSVGLPGREAAAEESVREVRIAVVGLGRQGLLLLGRLAGMPGVALKALCDLRPEALAEGVAVAGRGVETYRDLDYMLEEEALDALVVATPTHAHAGPARAALKTGLHVFCEAPLAHTVADCKAIARAAAAAAGRVFQTGHQRRTSRLYPHALLHVESGAIGEVLQIRAQWNRKRSWRRVARDPKLARLLNWRLDRKTSGGLLLEQGSHVFDLARWTLDALPQAVSGFGSLLHWKDGRDVDDAVQVALTYPGGVQVAYEVSLVSSYGDERELIVGDAATILCLGQHKGLLFKESDAAAIGWEQYAKTELLGSARGIVIDPEATKYASHEKAEAVGPEADKADLHAELTAFLAAVRGGEKPLCGAREGMQAAVTALVAAEAAATKRVIEFTDEHFEV